MSCGTHVMYEEDQSHCKVGPLPVQVLCYLLLQLEVVLTNVITCDQWSMLATAIIRVDGSENKADTPKFNKYHHITIELSDSGIGALVQGSSPQMFWTLRWNESEAVTIAEKSEWSVVFFFWVILRYLNFILSGQKLCMRYKLRIRSLYLIHNFSDDELSTSSTHKNI